MILHLFIKGYPNVDEPEVRSRVGFFAGLVGLVSNLILVVIKLLVGLLSFNISIVADALNNLSDFGSCVLSLFGFKLANKPADSDHPYGHERIEYVISLIISCVILALGLNIVMEAVKSLTSPGSGYSSFPLLTVVILAFSIGIKLFQAFVYFYLGKKIDSIALKASGSDARNDCLSTLMILVGVFISYYTGFTYIDGILAIVVSLFIFYSGIKILKETADVLIGEKPSDEVIKQFNDIIRSNKEVLGLHDLEMHCYGPNVTFASVHVEVDGSKDVYMLHDTIDNLEKECFEKLRIKTVIHMDPIKVGDKLTDYCKNIVLSVLPKVNSNLTIHDLRVVSGPSHTNVVFDVVVPHELINKKDQIKKRFDEEVKKIDTTLVLVINFDDQYTVLSKEND